MATKIIKTAILAWVNAHKEIAKKKEWERMVKSGTINVKEFNKKYLTD